MKRILFLLFLLPFAAHAQPAGSQSIFVGGTIVSGSNPVPVSGTFWQTTQPVSGTLTCNAGTNLNTSLLALETGGNLATLAGGVSSSTYQSNVKQINGVAPLMGNGVSGTGAQRVTIASDSTGQIAISGTVTVASHAVTNAGTFAVQAAGDVASGSSDSGSPVKIGGVGKTANPTAVTDGQRVNSLFDKLGKQVVVGSVRDLKGQQQTTITASTAETTVVTAVASTFLDVYGVIVTNTSATVTKVTFKDSTAGTTRFVLEIPPTETRGFMLPESGAITQATVNNNWTATCGTSVSSVEITLLYVKNT